MKIRTVLCSDGMLYMVRNDDYENGNSVSQNSSCFGCGTELNSDSSHVLHVFIGAFCPYHRCIHYRWVPEDWKFRDTLTVNSHSDSYIVPLGKYKNYFVGSHQWTDCSKYSAELMMSGLEILEEVEEWDASRVPLTEDTPYLTTRSKGIFAPVLTAVYEWLLLEDERKEIARKALESGLKPEEKSLLQKAAHSPTLTNVFKLIWKFHDAIPRWNKERTLGRNSPTRLLIQEIVWNSLSFTDIKKNKYLSHLLDYFPGKDGSYPEESELTFQFRNLQNLQKFFSFNSVRQIYPAFAELGLKCSQDTLELIKNHEEGTPWYDIARNLTSWPVYHEVGGKSKVEYVLEHGFLHNLRAKVGDHGNDTVVTSAVMARVNLPLCWLEEDDMVYRYIATAGHEDYLERTLISIKDLFSKLLSSKLVLVIPGELSELVEFKAFISRCEKASSITLSIA